MFLLLWREHNTPLALPTPTGPYAIGRANYTWVNDAVSGPLSPNGTQKETVVAWIWYPAARDAQSRRADSFPKPWQGALARHSGKLLTFLARDPNRVQGHSTIDPAVSPARPSYSVVIMRAGGPAFTTDYTTLAEDLASHRYLSWAWMRHIALRWSCCPTAVSSNAHRLQTWISTMMLARAEWRKNFCRRGMRTFASSWTNWKL